MKRRRVIHHFLKTLPEAVKWEWEMARIRACGEAGHPWGHTTCDQVHGVMIQACVRCPCSRVWPVSSDVVPMRRGQG